MALCRKAFEVNHAYIGPTLEENCGSMSLVFLAYVAVCIVVNESVFFVNVRENA